MEGENGVMLNPVFVSRNEKRSVVETMTGLLSILKPYCNEKTIFCIEKTLNILSDTPVDSVDEIGNAKDRLDEELGQSSFIFKQRKGKMDFNEFIQACNRARVEKEMEKQLND